MRTSSFVLSLLAGSLVGSSLFSQGRENRLSAQSSDRRGSGGATAESRSGGQQQPTMGRVIRAESNQPGQLSGFQAAPVRHIRRADAVVATPRYLHRCTVMPNSQFWQHRDIMGEIQWMSRRGLVPVTLVEEEINELNGIAEFPSGLRAYGFVVPVGGKLHVRLHHNNQGWFRVAMVDKWGDLTAGMLQNLIPTGNPEVRYTNLSKEARAVYVIVDDPGWMSSAAYPYTLNVQRDWEVGKADTKGVKVVEGIWASNQATNFSAEFARPQHRATFGVGSRW